MYVFGIGNVTECNKSYIHLNNEGKQESKKANVELLRKVLITATQDLEFYNRMQEELKALYERRKAEADRKYHWITDDMVKAAYQESSKKGFELSISQDINNEECVRRFGEVSGIYEGVKFANERYWEIRKIKIQAENALKECK